MVETERLLHHMIERRASDMHIVVGTLPQLRIDGELTATTFRAQCLMLVCSNFL